LRLAREWNDYWRAQNEAGLVTFTDLVIGVIEAELARVPPDREALARRLENLNPWKEMDWPERCREAATLLRRLSPATGAVETAGPVVWGLDIGALPNDPMVLKRIIAE